MYLLFCLLNLKHVYETLDVREIQNGEALQGRLANAKWVKAEMWLF